MKKSKEGKVLARSLYTVHLSQSTLDEVLAPHTAVRLNARQIFEAMSGTHRWRLRCFGH
jgi:hypothetical protein